MSTSATPVQLIDPNTGMAYAASGSSTAAAPGSDATNATSVQGVTAGRPVGIATLDEINTLAGRGFSWGSGVQTVPANNYFNAVFSNPTGSGKTAYIIFREFGNGSSTVLQAMLRTNVTAITGTAVSGGNRLMGSSNAAVSTLTYSVGTTAVTSGVAGPAKMLEINGAQSTSELLRIVPPGFNFCYIISGLTGAFAASTQIEFSLAGWEQ